MKKSRRIRYKVSAEIKKKAQKDKVTEKNAA